MPDVLVNPLRYRSEIFSAVRLSHKEELNGRYVHYDIRRDEPRLSNETTRPYTDSGPRIDIDVTVTKAGHRYRVEGTIVDKKECNTFSILGFLRTIPARYSASSTQAEIQPYQTPTLTEVRERLIGLQLQLDEIRREQVASIRSPFSPPDATPTYHYEPRYQGQYFTPYSPHPHSYEPHNNTPSY